MTHRLLFVCMGNICRSPTAKGVFDRALVEAGIDFESESAGTHGYHTGHPPDARSVEVAAERGLDISSDRSRLVVVEDFDRFDWVFAMDRSNLQHLQQLCPAQASVRLQLVMDLVPEYGLDEVPDPYYGGEQGFRQVFDMLEQAADAMVRELNAASSR